MSLPGLLLLHGALASSTQFDLLKPVLEKDFEVFTFDFPGHGGSDIPSEPFSFSLFVSAISRFLAEQNIQTINVFGYSMGGYAALSFAKDHPQLVNKVFTLATKLDWNEAASQREASMLNPEKMEEKIPAFAKLLESRHHPQDWKKIVSKTREMMLGLGKNHLAETDFKSIRHPVMLSVGDKDNMVTAEETKLVSRLIPNGAFHIFPDTFHPFEKIKIDVLIPELKTFFS